MMMKARTIQNMFWTIAIYIKTLKLTSSQDNLINLVVVVSIVL